MTGEGDKTQAGIPAAASRAARPPERAFRLALVGAALAHAVLVAAFLHSPPTRRMGEKGGQAEGVSVAMVDAADLRSLNSLAEDGMPSAARMPAPPSPQVSPQVAPAVPPEQKQEADTASRAPQAPQLVAPEEAARHDRDGKQQAKEQKQAREQRAKDQKEQQDEAPVSWPTDVQALEPQPQPAPAAGAQTREPEARPKKAPKPAPTQIAKASPPMQLSLPDMSAALGGQAPGFARPAGITRSGENDEFGRGVIRALRKTMPDMSPIRGRATVRIVLSNNGDLLDVQLVRSSGNAKLDQGVIFAVRQSSFPFPPPNAPLVDRTFLVTYVYDRG